MNTKSMVLDWIDIFVPKSIKNDRKLTWEMQVRARGMVAILGISILLPLLVLTAFIILQLFTRNDFSQDIIALLVTEIILISQHLYFQSYGNLRVTAAAYSMQYVFSITFVILISGGWSHSPLLVLLIASPLLAFITISSSAALYHSLLVFIINGILLMLQVNHITLPDISREENYPYTTFIAWGITLAFMAIFLVFTEQLVREKPRR